MTLNETEIVEWYLESVLEDLTKDDVEELLDFGRKVLNNEIDKEKLGKVFEQKSLLLEEKIRRSIGDIQHKHIFYKNVENRKKLLKLKNKVEVYYLKSRMTKIREETLKDFVNKLKKKKEYKEEMMREFDVDELLPESEGRYCEKGKRDGKPKERRPYLIDYEKREAGQESYEDGSEQNEN